MVSVVFSFARFHRLPRLVRNSLLCYRHIPCHVLASRENDASDTCRGAEILCLVSSFPLSRARANGILSVCCIKQMRFLRSASPSCKHAQRRDTDEERERECVRYGIFQDTQRSFALPCPPSTVFACVHARVRAGIHSARNGDSSDDTTSMIETLGPCLGDEAR